MNVHNKIRAIREAKDSAKKNGGFECLTPNNDRDRNDEIQSSLELTLKDRAVF